MLGSWLGLDCMGLTAFLRVYGLHFLYSFVGLERQSLHSLAWAQAWLLGVGLLDMRGVRYRVQGLGFRVWGLGGFWGFGFRVLGFKVKGLGLSVKALRTRGLLGTWGLQGSRTASF